MPAPTASEMQRAGNLNGDMFRSGFICSVGNGQRPFTLHAIRPGNRLERLASFAGVDGMERGWRRRLA